MSRNTWLNLCITCQTHLLANSSVVDVETLRITVTNMCLWHFQVQEEEPSKKRYRMDLQRHLSLDLEREPVLDDSAEEGSEFESAAIRDIFGPSSHREKPGKSSGGGISLDINATPDPSTPAESMSNGSRGHDPEAISLSPPQYQQPLNLSAVLHVVYKCLEDQFGEGVFEKKEDCIQGGSLRINFSPDNVADFQGDKGSSQPDDDREKPIVVLVCKWGADAEVLANRSLGILRRLKLKL